ncbi:MAG: tRNA (N6-threonylcarbamoyladenosine(37)-N6)-methyltransferase TrmO [Beijerinckiaceae bacterium]
MIQSDDNMRPGEERIDTPSAYDAHIVFIGRIRTPWTSRADCPKNSREAAALGEAAHCTIELDARLVRGLLEITKHTHLWALYWMDRARRDLIVQAPGHLDAPRGVFALRSPVRPNPVAMAAVRLIDVEGVRLTVLGLDCLDGTPLIDLKPYFASTDSIPQALLEAASDA